MNDTITGPDGKHRCHWCAAAPEYLHYHDTEWGFPVDDDIRLFEKLCLEGFQSGLSWRTILAKRENFRAAFRDFDFDRIARFTRRDLNRLLKDEGIVERSVKVNEESKAIVHQTLDELGLEYLPTNTNFIMHQVNGDLGTYRDRMADKGLLVGRNFPPMLDYNRVSFGLPNEMDRWADALKEFRTKGWI